MNILLDYLPETVEIGGAVYPINSDFRTSVLFELLMQDDEVDDKVKVGKALRLYYPELPLDTHEAVRKMLWFYKCDKEGRGNKRGAAAQNEAEQSVKRVYSFDYDDAYIFAAFWSQYGVDLNDIDYLHWWKFRAMFHALDESCEFCKIMGYRSVKITSKMSKEQKRFYREMKEIHALPLPRDEVEKTDAIAQALMNGGDLTGLL